MLGTGGNVALTFDAPPVSESTLENWKDVLSVVASEVRERLKYQGIFVVLDNAETVDNEHLASLMMSFRDTLFTVAGIWWVFIGQSGLYSLIDATDKRISQRIQGTGLEVAPLSAKQLHEVVERRVRRFRAREDAVSPISHEVHSRLYDASKGEIRFVLKTSDALIRRVIANFRKDVAKIVKDVPETGFEDKFVDILSKRLVEGQVPDKYIKACLRDLTFESLRDLRLRKSELAVLQAIGEGEARAKDHARFRVGTMQDFSANYLTKMFRSGLLHRRQAGRAVYYSLRGFAALAHEYGLFPRLLSVSQK